MDKVQLLEAARNLIQKHGWVKEGFGGEDNGFCVDGACRFATVGTTNRTALLYADRLDSYMEVTCALGEVLGVDTIQDIWDWNDDPNRTQEDVLIAFDQVIANEKAKLDV